MCGRYDIDDSLEGFEELLEALNRDEIRTGEIRPTDAAPVIANSRARRKRPFLMRWGFAGPGGHPIINARSETALIKPMFRDSMLERRCLVPASRYYEWQGKRRHAFRTEEPVFYMAGLYRLEPDEPMASFTILTREADAHIAHIHDRMPVILPGDWADAWLSQTADVGEMLTRARGAACVREMPV